MPGPQRGAEVAQRGAERRVARRCARRMSLLDRLQLGQHLTSTAFLFNNILGLLGPQQIQCCYMDRQTACALKEVPAELGEFFLDALAHPQRLRLMHTCRCPASCLRIFCHRSSRISQRPLCGHDIGLGRCGLLFHNRFSSCHGGTNLLATPLGGPHGLLHGSLRRGGGCSTCRLAFLDRRLGLAPSGCQGLLQKLSCPMCRRKKTSQGLLLLLGELRCRFRRRPMRRIGRPRALPEPRRPRLRGGRELGSLGGHRLEGRAGLAPGRQRAIRALRQAAAQVLAVHQRGIQRGGEHGGGGDAAVREGGEGRRKECLLLALSLCGLKIGLGIHQLVLCQGCTLHVFLDLAVLHCERRLGLLDLLVQVGDLHLQLRPVHIASACASAEGRSNVGQGAPKADRPKQGRGHGPVLHPGGLLGITQGGDRLLDCIQGGGDGGDDNGFTAASQRILQQPRELRVPVGHPACAVSKRGDDAAEGQQALVDVLALSVLVGPSCFLVAGMSRTIIECGLLCALAPGQVHEVQLAAILELARRHETAAFHFEREDAMRTAAPSIDPRLRHMPSILRDAHQVQDIAERPHGHLREPRADDALAVTDVLKVQLRCLNVRGHQQVSEVLVVDLQVRAADRIVRILAPGQPVDDGLRGAGHEAATHVRVELPLHGVGLARTRLTIGKRSGLVACKNLVNERVQGRGEDLALRAEGSKHLVEVEERPDLPGAAADPAAQHANDRHLLALRRGRSRRDGASLPLALRHGAEAANDTDGAGDARCLASGAPHH
mmetsp:Transcript_176231/g.565009  ORF Transcript_176231/g.565009 Transcript_176231/m.565009 type:complete len:775 (+) Transcript_176231:2375-4699(+)